MKKEKYNITEHIAGLYEKSKDLPDKVFYVARDECINYCKVTTKTLELACAFAERFEVCIYDSWADDDSFDCWGIWEDAYDEVNYDDIEEWESIYDLDNYSFKYGEWPDYISH